MIVRARGTSLFGHGTEAKDRDVIYRHSCGHCNVQKSYRLYSVTYSKRYIISSLHVVDASNSDCVLHSSLKDLPHNLLERSGCVMPWPIELSEAICHFHFN